QIRRDTRGFELPLDMVPTAANHPTLALADELVFVAQAARHHRPTLSLGGQVRHGPRLRAGSIAVDLDRDTASQMNGRGEAVRDRENRRDRCSSAKRRPVAD